MAGSVERRLEGRGITTGTPQRGILGRDYGGDPVSNTMGVAKDPGLWKKIEQLWQSIFGGQTRGWSAADEAQDVEARARVKALEQRSKESMYR